MLCPTGCTAALTGRVGIGIVGRMGAIDATAERFAGLVSKGFDKAKPDLGSVHGAIGDLSERRWILKQMAIAVGTGGAAMSIPFAHVATLAADVALLLNRMAVVSAGIGAIRARDARLDGFVEVEDLALVLAVWAGDDPFAILSDAGTSVSAKSAAKLGVKLGGKKGSKLIAKSIAASTQVMIGNKLGPKVAAKAGTKLAAKFAGKGAAGFVPFIGPAIGASLNAYFVNSFAGAAKTWYSRKAQVFRDGIEVDMPDPAV